MSTPHKQVVIKRSPHLMVTAVSSSNDNSLHFLLKQNLLLAIVTAYNLTTQGQLANMPAQKELHFIPHSLLHVIPFVMV